MYRVLTQGRPKLIGVKKKLDRREAVRERKALSAAHLERSIEKELIERLRSKAYGDAPLNVNEQVWQAVLDQSNARKDKENMPDGVQDMEDDETDEEEYEEELEEEMDDEWGTREFVSDMSGDDDESGPSDLEDLDDASEEEEEEEVGQPTTRSQKPPLGKRKAELPLVRKSAQKKSKRMCILVVQRIMLTKRVAGGPRVEVEYEQETELVAPARVTAR